MERCLKVYLKGRKAGEAVILKQHHIVWVFTHLQPSVMSQPPHMSQSLILIMLLVSVQSFPSPNFPVVSGPHLPHFYRLSVSLSLSKFR